MIIIDATDMILGRLCSKAAKAALMGEEVAIVNCGKAVISGDRKQLITEYNHKKNMGTHAHGPFFYSRPEMFVKRAVRGMVPVKQAKGRAAYERIMCYRGVPENFAGKPMETVEGANYTKLPKLKYARVDDICKMMGAKI
jgi:large subunit ribosomal protein L13